MLILRNFRIILEPIQSVTNNWFLLKEFVTRDIKGRFAGSFGGIIWTLINPIASIIVYSYLFAILLRMQVNANESGTDSFLIYFLSGFFPWLLFSESISRSSGVLIENANLITKVVFPVELLPIGMVLSSFIIYGIGFAIFLLYLLVLGYFHIIWVVIPLLIIFHYFFIWGIACFFSALTVFIRDVREFLGIMLMVWFYATPILYPASIIPESFKVIVLYNPMNIFISLYRDLILLHTIHWESIVYMIIMTLLSYTTGSYFFMRSKPAFGDVL